MNQSEKASIHPIPFDFAIFQAGQSIPFPSFGFWTDWLFWFEDAASSSSEDTHSPRAGAMESAKAKNPVGGDDEEVSVGIECYANSASGFQAILKERYTDFIVN